ncbi:MAG: sugar translocase [Ruminococcaceae bacterium]|nr:sugar translocase [Oscillospiraceae bacterium]
MSRTKNSIKNAFTGIMGQILVIIMQFLTRTVFIYTLNEQYLGISGLFTNIISMLSLAELGVGTAIMYKLFKPIEEEDQHKIYLIMKFYKTVYRAIGLVILVIGLALMPFLKFFIKGDISFVNIYFIFFLHLIQCVSSYIFYAYKSALINANQKEYITSLINTIFLFISNIAQIISLFLCKSFELYITISIFNIIAINIAASIFCNKLYPYINKKTNETLPKEEKKEIFKDCYALFIYKVNGVVLSATDNIIISKFIGIITVGFYSNYSMIYSILNNFLTKFYNAITASLGNLHAQNDKKTEYDVFMQINFLTFVISTVAGVEIALVSNEFIKLWIGEKFVISEIIAWLLGYKFFLEGQKKVLSTYRNTMGIFQQAKYRPAIGALINLIVSIILVKFIGLPGVILGTVIADLSTYMWYDPKIIYQNSFEEKVIEYYIKRLKYTIVFFICGIISLCIIKITPITGLFGFIIHSGICILVSAAVILVLFRNTKEFQSSVNRFLKIIKRR